MVDLSGGLDGAVWSLITHQSRLVVGGSFTAAFGLSGSKLQCGGLVQWNPSTSMWGSVGSSGGGLSSGSYVAALAVAGPNMLVVGGRFTFAGGLLANHIAIFQGSLAGPEALSDEWTTFGAGVGGGFVTSLAVTGQNRDQIYVGGTFSSVFTPDAAGSEIIEIQYRYCVCILYFLSK